MLVISTGRNRRDTQWKNCEISWEDLMRRLRTPKRTTETTQEYESMDKDARGAIKDVGGFVGGKLKDFTRRASSVESRSLITLDADNAFPRMWESVTMLNDFCMACYSTHSHTLEKPRLRFVIPLSRPVTPEEYVPIARRVAFWLFIETMDPTTYQPERLMYWPSASIDAPYEFHKQRGEFLDPDEVLASYGKDEAWKNTTLWPRAESETKEIATRLKTKVQDPITKGGIIGQFCRAYSVPEAITEFLFDVYEEGEDGRYTYILGSACNGAVLFEEGKFLYSHHATDPASEQMCNSFDLVRIHRFGGLDEGHVESEGSMLPSMKAMLDLANKDKLVLKLQQEEMMQDFYPLMESKGQTLSVDISDKGLARMFHLFVKGEVVYCSALGYLVWDGKRFIEDNSAAMLRIIAFIEEVERRLFEHCLTSETDNLLGSDSVEA